MSNGNIKNITFSAPEELIEAAQDKAKKLNTSLDELFCDWLKSLATSENEFSMKEVRNRYGYISNEGKKLTREELNKR